MRAKVLALLIFGTLTAVCLAETGTPYPAGTKVEIGTPAGTVSGTLTDRVKDGWISVLEPGRKFATAIPERSVGFIRPDAPAALAKVPRPFAAPPTAAFEASLHFVFGQPQIKDPGRFKFKPFAGSDEEVAGITVLKRFAFTLGHYDRYKVPAWVAMRWSTDEHDIAADQPTHPRNFKADTELPPHARTDKDYQHAIFKYERGHMARHEDLSGFGAQGDPLRGTREGCFMSNIVPQQRKGHIVWGELENEHHEVVARPDSGISAVWLIAGPVFEEGKARDVIGPAKVGAPHAVYKIIAWKGPGGSFTARAFIIGQEDTSKKLTKYLKTVREVEEATGLDFFAEMDDEEEEELETREFGKLWEDE